MKPNSILSGLLLIVSIFAVAEFGIGVHQVRRKTDSIGTSLKQTVDDLDATVLIARGAVMNANLVLGRIEEASQSWQKASEKQARYWITLQDKSLVTLDSLNTLSASLNALVINTDKSINSELLPRTSETIEQATTTLKSLDTAILEASDRANANLEDIHNAISDPSISASLREIQGASENIRVATEQVSIASRELPEIAKDLEQISKTSSKYAKPIMIARIVSLLSWIVPWLF